VQGLPITDSLVARHVSVVVAPGVGRSHGDADDMARASNEDSFLINRLLVDLAGAKTLLTSGGFGVTSRYALNLNTYISL
jgi:hypothetical protein